MLDWYVVYYFIYCEKNCNESILLIWFRPSFDDKNSCHHTIILRMMTKT